MAISRRCRTAEEFSCIAVNSAASKFWSGALGLPLKAGYDPKYVGLTTPPNGLAIEVQAVEHPSRVHLDIESDDVEAEVARLEKLGAKRIEKRQTWWVMQAPTAGCCKLSTVTNSFPSSVGRKRMQELMAR